MWVRHERIEWAETLTSQEASSGGKGMQRAVSGSEPQLHLSLEGTEVSGIQDCAYSWGRWRLQMPYQYAILLLFECESSVQLHTASPWRLAFHEHRPHFKFRVTSDGPKTHAIREACW